MISIDKLDWDSRFFNIQIGMCTINQNDTKSLDEYKEISQKYDLVYIFSQHNNLNFKLVDKKLVYSIEDIAKFLVDRKSMDCDLRKIEYYKHNMKNYKDILNLALQSGEFSRFNLDKNFKNNEYERLYKEWVDSSITKKNAQKIIIKKIENKVVGFATLSKVDDEQADIGLVAVDENYRGRGIAKEIILNVIINAKEMGFNKIQVATQLDNLAAVNLYSSIGFEKKSLTYIYHHWNYDTI